MAGTANLTALEAIEVIRKHQRPSTTNIKLISITGFNVLLPGQISRVCSSKNVYILNITEGYGMLQTRHGIYCRNEFLAHIPFITNIQ